MKTRSKKIILSLCTMVALLAVAAFALIPAGGITPSFAKGDKHHSTPVSTDYPVPAGTSYPWGVALGSKGQVWVALPGCDPNPLMCSTGTPPGKLALFNANTHSWVGTYTLPAGFAQPFFLKMDAQGKVWFTLPMGNAIGMYDPVAKTFQQWTVPTANAGPWGIAIDKNGNIWFTEHYINSIGRFSPVTHSFLEVATVAPNSQPYGITVDSSNNVWFTENNASVAAIDKYTPQGVLTRYTIRTSYVWGLTPHLITVDGRGNVWWSEGFVGRIGELKVSQAQPGTNNGVTEYAYTQPCSNCGSHTSGIALDTHGNVWFDDSLQSIFGSFPISGTGSFKLFNTPTGNSHPHDGLVVDGSGRVFFDEEFANKLAKYSSGTTATPTRTPTP